MSQTHMKQVWDSVDETFGNQFIADANEKGILRWENILNIQPKATEGLDARKFRIVSRLNEQLPYTMTTLMQILETLCGKNNYSVNLKNEIYTLIVRVGLSAKSNYDDVESLLRRITPANLIIDLSLKYNQQSTLAVFTHGKLSRYTHNQLRNEVLNHA